MKEFPVKYYLDRNGFRKVKDCINMRVEPETRFGRLVTVQPIKGGKFWECRCDCGNITKASKWHLEHNHRLTCGCRLEIKPTEYVCQICKLTKPREEFYMRNNGHLYHSVCRKCHIEKMKNVSRARHIALRRTALEYYGNDEIKCVCCGEAVIEFLVLDHIDGDGNKHREETKGHIYRWLAKQDYPDIGLRVLCANCN